MTLAEREKQIREHAKRLAHRFSSRFGCVTMEDTLCDMGRWCDANQPSPWVSVEERLPEKDEIVLTHISHIIDGAGEHKEDEMIIVQRYKNKWDTDSVEQHRMGGYLFDTISKVTHWMPIPPIAKGGER